MALQLFKIASTTIDIPQATVDFTSIPGGYTDLYLVISSKTSATTSGENGTDINLRFNNDSASNYTNRIIYNTLSVGSIVNTGTSVYWSGQANNSAGTMTNTFSSISIYVPNYAGATNKTVSIDSVAEANATTQGMVISSGVWQSTAAINRVTLLLVSGSFTANSTFTLYGVL